MADPINLGPMTQDAGIPAQWSQDINVAQPSLITGNSPALVTQDLIVKTGQNLLALTPMMFDVGKELVPAVAGTPAVAILVAATNTMAGAKGAPTYRAGCFNPEALNWDASLNTEAERFNAFEGAGTPTNIIIRRAKTYSV